MPRFSWMLLCLFVLVMPAHADEVVYPPGSRIGLVPPRGLHASASFPGFEDRDKAVAVLLGALPPDAYAELEKSDSAEGLKKLGATLEKRELLNLPTGKAVLVIGRQDKQHTWMLVAAMPDLTAMVTLRIPDTAKDVYSDSVVRAMFASLAVRPEVPIEEQLGLLPFRLGELAGFKIGGVLPGRGVLLTDAAGGTAIEPHIIIALMPGAAAEAADRDDIARQIFRSIPNLKDVRITGSESIRMSGQQGHEIMASAKDPATGAELSLVQWLRFGSGAYLHVVGMAPTPAWTQAYARFRSVRDGIEAR
ncbi:MAG TPA: hypothetical protein VGN55_01165 [Xanthobacteraceae bacterium]|jgi:hypothetical protein